jgi:hypothetical protein
MDFYKANPSQRPKKASAAYLGQFAHAALAEIRNVSKLARGFGSGRFSFLSPSK